MTTHSKRWLTILIGAAFCAGWMQLAEARETVFRVDFGQEGRACSYEKIGRFQGTLPPRVSENFAAWNASVARTERLTEDGRTFLRFHTEKIDSL